MQAGGRGDLPLLRFSFPLLLIARNFCTFSSASKCMILGKNDLINNKNKERALQIRESKLLGYKSILDHFHGQIDIHLE